MHKFRKIISLAVILITSAMLCLNAQMTLKAKVAAKVNNEIILQSDVNKHAKLYKVSYDEALRELIDDALLYAGAKIAVPEPNDDEVLVMINEDKAYYANQVHKDVKDISEQEFLNALLTNNVSMKTFKEYKKRQLWISNYVASVLDSEAVKYYFPTDAEIAAATEAHPDLLLEGAGAAISMIMFSAYNRDGQLESQVVMKEKLRLAEECLEKLKKGSDFIDMVIEYSDDLVTRDDPDAPGYAGVVAFDDPRVEKSFPQNVIKALESAEVGTLLQIFQTNAGLYIFKVEAKIPPTKLYGDEARLKVESFLKNEHKKNLREKTRTRLIQQLEKEFDIRIY